MINNNLIGQKPVRPWMFKLVWIGVFIVYAQYSLIVFMSGRHAGTQPEHATSVVTVLCTLGIISLFAGICMKKYFFSQGWVRRFLDKQDQLSSGHVPGMPPDAQTLERLLQSTFSLYLMSLGLVNTCAVFGMVAALISRKGFLVYTPYLVGAVIGTLLCYPNVREFLEESSMA